MSEVRSRKLDQIRKLLDKASDAATTPHEAEALRKKADDMMLAYTISEFEVQARKPRHEREKPENRRINVCGENHPLKTQMVELFDMVVRHARCKAVFSGLTDQKARCVATVIGFPTDLEFVEMLATSLMVQMSRELEPKPDPHFTEAENLCLLKEAGMKWERIHELLYPSTPWERRHGVRYTKVYTDYCKSTGRERMRSSPLQYQRNFAEGFKAEVNRRFGEIAKARKQDHTPGTGMDLVLADLTGEVNAAFAAMFPSSRSVALAGRSKQDWAAQGRGREAGARADLGQQRMARTKELT